MLLVLHSQNQTLAPVLLKMGRNIFDEEFNFVLNTITKAVHSVQLQAL
jgi:hypothetical protein